MTVWPRLHRLVAWFPAALPVLALTGIAVKTPLKAVAVHPTYLRLALEARVSTQRERYRNKQGHKHLLHVRL